jgi:dihydroxy-acid dehydratase
LPSELLTPAAFHNAQVVLQAIGGSTNGLIHLTAIANRTEHSINLEAFDKLGREVRCLSISNRQVSIIWKTSIMLAAFQS